MISKSLQDILAERARQDDKWGEQNHDPFAYITILVEEIGELAQAALHTRFGGHAAEGLRTEAIHTAAVALAIVECLDRGKWSWGHDPAQVAFRKIRQWIESEEKPGEWTAEIYELAGKALDY